LTSVQTPFLIVILLCFQESCEKKSATKSQPPVPQHPMHYDPLGAGMISRVVDTAAAPKKKTRLEFSSGTARAPTPAQPLKCCYKSCGKTAKQTAEKTLFKVQNHSGKTRYCKTHADQNPCSTFVIADDYK
jgi:hypothetical protein